jgi:hypothetical protein
MFVMVCMFLVILNLNFVVAIDGDVGGGFGINIIVGDVDMGDDDTDDNSNSNDKSRDSDDNSNENDDEIILNLDEINNENLNVKNVDADSQELVYLSSNENLNKKGNFENKIPIPLVLSSIILFLVFLTLFYISKSGDIKNLNKEDFNEDIIKKAVGEK